MDYESRQTDIIQQFLLLANSTRGRGTVELIGTVVGEPGLFAFGELLEHKQISALRDTIHASALDLLNLFAYGTWADYKNSVTSFELNDAQKLKLQQLTVLTLAEQNKILSYDHLMKELDIPNVRELEDLLINDCMYMGIIRGRLDQKKRCLEVHFAASRDLKPGKLDEQIEVLSLWLKTCESLMDGIEDKIEWADAQGKKKVEDLTKIEERIQSLRRDAQVELESQKTQGEAPQLGEDSQNFLGLTHEGGSNRARPKRWKFWYRLQP